MLVYQNSLGVSLYHTISCFTDCTICSVLLSLDAEWRQKQRSAVKQPGPWYLSEPVGATLPHLSAVLLMTLTSWKTTTNSPSTPPIHNSGFLSQKATDMTRQRFSLLLCPIVWPLRDRESSSSFASKHLLCFPEGHSTACFIRHCLLNIFHLSNHMPQFVSQDYWRPSVSIFFSLQNWRSDLQSVCSN